MKKRQRSLQRRLANLAKLQQALVATWGATSASRPPVLEPEPEPPLPAIGGTLLWDATINGVDAPHPFGMPPPQQPPAKIPAQVTIQLPAPAAPLTGGCAVTRRPTALQPRPSSCLLVLLRVQPALPPPERSAQRHPRFPVLWSPALTTIIFRLPPPRRLEQLPEKPLPQEWSLPRRLSVPPICWQRYFQGNRPVIAFKAVRPPVTVAVDGRLPGMEKYSSKNKRRRSKPLIVKYCPVVIRAIDKKNQRLRFYKNVHYRPKDIGCRQNLCNKPHSALKKIVYLIGIPYGGIYTRKDKRWGFTATHGKQSLLSFKGRSSSCAQKCPTLEKLPVKLSKQPKLKQSLLNSTERSKTIHRDYSTLTTQHRSGLVQAMTATSPLMKQGGPEIPADAPFETNTSTLTVPYQGHHYPFNGY